MTEMAQGSSTPPPCDGGEEYIAEVMQLLQVIQSFSDFRSGMAITRLIRFCL